MFQIYSFNIQRNLIEVERVNTQVSHDQTQLAIVGLHHNVKIFGIIIEISEKFWIAFGIYANHFIIPNSTTIAQ